MKLKYAFEIMQIEDEHMAVPIGEKADELHAVFKLNKTAADILELLKEDTTEEEIIKKLSEKYDGSQDEIRKAVLEYISELKEAELLE